MIFSYPVTDDVEFHFQAPDERVAADLVAWLIDAPVRSRGLETWDKGAWNDIYRRSFDGPREVMETIQKLRENLADLKSEEVEADAEIRRLSREGAKYDVVSPLVRSRIPVRKAILAQEQMTWRLSRYLNHMLTKEATQFQGDNLSHQNDPSTVRGADSDFARRTSVQEMTDSVDKAIEILGTIPGAPQEVNKAYAILEYQRDTTLLCDIQTAESEIQREWIRWLSEMVALSYRGSFDIKSENDHMVTELPAVKLHRPVSVGEIRAVMSGRPPQIIDERMALAGDDEPAKPYF